jgi:hypothetical protein
MEGFRVNAITRKQLANRKRRIQRRLAAFPEREADVPVLAASNIHYELAAKTRGIACGGIGAVHRLARQIGLIEAIDRRLHLLKIHHPYHESDHVLAIAYNALCGGTCLEDLELRRQDEVFLDALGAARLPDPTTAGDFCRRFRETDIRILQDVCHEARLRVWAQQPPEFFARAILESDGHLVETSGQCKQGMDVAYDGTWGYHPLVVSLANTAEVLAIRNRSGNRPSHEGAGEEFDRAIALCRRAGFRAIVLRGDTDFSLTEKFDAWDQAGVTFYFGYDAYPNLIQQAEALAENAWNRLARPARYEVRTRPRARPENVKAQVVRRREFENLRLEHEDVAEFDYRPTKCTNTYRMIVLRKNLSREKGEKRLFDEIRYFFYITNDRNATPADVVFGANDRCNQENLIAQLSGGLPALKAPVDSLTSNGAYMVMTALAWNLKAWFGLMVPARPGRWQARHAEQKKKILTMEFKTFVNAFIRIPCQIIRSGRRLIYRLLAWNPWQPALFRLLRVLRC